MNVDHSRDLQRLIDRADITDLVHRYSYLVDTQRYDDVVELFTEECVVDYGPGVGGERRGRQALRSMFGDRFVVTSHHNANVLISHEGVDRAVVTTSLYAWHLTVGGEAPRVWGYYDDVVERIDGEWLIAERRLLVAGNEGLDLGWTPLIGD